MCWLCDNPDATREDYLRTLRGFMDEFGWAVQYVEARRPYSPTAYTIGLTLYDLPELVVTGLSPGTSSGYLNAIARYCVEKADVLPGQIFSLIGERTFEAVAVREPAIHLPVAHELVESPIRALQMVWHDDRGRLPWDRGFRSRRWAQPVLGDRSPRPADERIDPCRHVV